MTEDEIRTALLDLSRNVPMRQCSPYGHLDTDDAKVRDIARNAYELLEALTTFRDAAIHHEEPPPAPAVVERGFYCAEDCDYRVNTVVFSDGAFLYLPGSSVAFTGEDARRRFNVKQKLDVPDSQYGAFEVCMGRHK